MPSLVAFVLGSDSDLPGVEAAFGILQRLEIPFEVRILSAHRTPDEAARFAREAAGRGVRVLVAAAGGAAHLAGAMAAHSPLPVIGVPLDATPLAGFDALLSTVQMPPGVPVATVAVGPFGAENAAWLAARILALVDADIAARLEAERQAMERRVLEKDEQVRSRYSPQ